MDTECSQAQRPHPKFRISTRQNERGRARLTQLLSSQQAGCLELWNLSISVMLRRRVSCLPNVAAQRVKCHTSNPASGAGVSTLTQQRFKGQKDTYTRPLTTSRTIPRRPKIRLAELASCSWSPDWERSVLSKARKKKLTAENRAIVALMWWSR